MALNRQNIEQLSDEELIHRFQRDGHRIYVSMLYRRYEHLVYGNALKYFTDHNDRKDVVGEVFEKVMRKLPDTAVKSFPNWLFIMTRNICISRLRKHSPEYSSSDNWEEVEKKSDNFMENAAVARLMNEQNSNQQLELLREAVAELNEEQRKCVQLFFLEEKSYREITEITAFSIKKVKSMLQNGKRNLRIQLNKKLATINFWLLLSPFLF
ncbi:MAG: RNA polymerase sigma factor [Saprospiraceae bacterium]